MDSGVSKFQVFADGFLLSDHIPSHHCDDGSDDYTCELHIFVPPPTPYEAPDILLPIAILSAGFLLVIQSRLDPEKQVEVAAICLATIATGAFLTWLAT